MQVTSYQRPANLQFGEQSSRRGNITGALFAVGLLGTMGAMALNVAAAMLLGLVLPIVFLTVQMSYQQRVRPVADLPYRRR